MNNPSQFLNNSSESKMQLYPATSEQPESFNNSIIYKKLNELQDTVLMMAKTIEMMQQSNNKPRVTKEKNTSLFTTHEIPKPKSQPMDSIKTLEEIDMVLQYFLQHKQYRNYALFVTGISSAYRISDLLRLKYSSFYNTDGSFKLEFDIPEQKTGNRRKMEITKPVQEAIDLYVEKSGIDFDYESPIFRSEKCKDEAIKEETVHKILKTVGRELKLPYNIGTHSMRKTWAYWYLQLHKNDMTALSTLQEAFGHSSERQTLRYCGISKEEIRENNRDVSNLWQGLMNKQDLKEVSEG